MKNDHRTYFVIRNLIHYFKDKEEQPYEGEMEMVWDSIMKRVKEDNSAIRRRRTIRRIISISAAAILILTVGIGITHQLHKGKDISEIASELAKVTLPYNEIQLIISSQEVLSVKKGATVTYSSDGSVIVDKEKVSEEVENESESANQYNQLIVPKGKHTQLQLADGSSLHINSGTKVVYPRVFQKDRREIYVDGEIFIDVKRDESMPFIVKTAHFEVEVLGTAFNVNAYSQDAKSEVVLVRGLVHIKDKTEKKIQLHPNELATINGGTINGKRTVDVSNYIAWTQGLLVLNGIPLGSVIQQLERYYGNHIDI